MSKPITNAAYNRLIKSLPRDKQIESVERGLRVLPSFIMEEVARTNPNKKVIKHQ